MLKRKRPEHGLSPQVDINVNNISAEDANAMRDTITRVMAKNFEMPELQEIVTIKLTRGSARLLDTCLRCFAGLQRINGAANDYTIELADEIKAQYHTIRNETMI